MAKAKAKAREPTVPRVTVPVLSFENKQAWMRARWHRWAENAGQRRKENACQ